MKCHSELVKALGDNALPYRTVPLRVGKFQQGRLSISDEQRIGGLVSVRTDSASALIQQLMDEDQRGGLLELETASGIKKRTFYSILRNELQLRKITEWWVPHVLTEIRRWLSYPLSSDHFARWLQDGDQFLSRIIAIDEFYARAYELELKRQFA
ncbi:histone-lysine N-methyltransferase SETMAR [Trichonephila clavipes]|nr:histone-lysine N-methyltransferase SETMAR [Trichonephila clavipes]